MDHIMECIQKLQALSQQLENKKTKGRKKYRLRLPLSGCKASGS
jgi:hypothetical protein